MLLAQNKSKMIQCIIKEAETLKEMHRYQPNAQTKLLLLWRI
jgi:hypothetical protein